MAKHELKCWPEFFRAIQSGRKTFEVRRGHERNFQVGDVLQIREWDPKTKEYTGSEFRARVGYVMQGKPFLPEDLWVLGIVKA